MNKFTLSVLFVVSLPIVLMLMCLNDVPNNQIPEIVYFMWLTGCVGCVVINEEYV